MEQLWSATLIRRPWLEIIYLLIPLGLILLVFAIWAFFWAVKNDQFEDLEKQAHQILFEEDEEYTYPPEHKDQQSSGSK